MPASAALPIGIKRNNSRITATDEKKFNKAILEEN